MTEITDHRLLREFLAAISAERGASANTLAAYERDLVDFLAHTHRRNIDATGARPADVTIYLRSLTEAGLAAASRARKLSSIRQFYKFLTAEGHVDENPTELLAGPKKERPLPKTLSVSEVDLL
ncbi:MAG: site-specific integrase, partial [Hyphomicrobiaceae bacterium]|nr:site-specific integrase [Hyphomicrobiaceae bacterium]